MTPRRVIIRVLITIGGLFVLGALLVPLLSRHTTSVQRLDVARGDLVDVHIDRGAMTVHRGDAGFTAKRGYVLSEPSITVTRTDTGVAVNATCPGWAFVSCSTDIDLTVPEGVNVSVRTARGPITVRDASGEVYARSDLGRISVSGAPEVAQARSVENDITLDLAARPREVGATSETGAIVVRLPGGVYKTVDVVSKAGARTVKGVTSDTDAKGTIVVHSGAGDVEVQGDR